MAQRGHGKIDITKLPEKEFKIKVISMLMEEQKNIQELRDEFMRETDTLKNTVAEMKQTMEGFKSRLDEVEETVNGIEIREQEYREAEAEKEKSISRNERLLRKLCEQSK